MLHAIKRKTLGSFQARKEPKSSEFADVQQRLDNVQKALIHALDSIDKSQKAWKHVSSTSFRFCEGLHSLYPEHDKMRDLFKKTLDESGQLEKELVLSGDSAESKVKSIERMVRGYLAEIKTLKGEYGNVEVARRDYGMYSRKVDKLQGKRKAEEKKSKFLDKLESSKATYDSILQGIVHRMNSTYSKATVMFNAVFVAYWLTQKNSLAIVTKHSTPPMSYASVNEDNLFKLTETSRASSQ